MPIVSSVDGGAAGVIGVLLAPPTPARRRARAGRHRCARRVRGGVPRCGGDPARGMGRPSRLVGDPQPCRLTRLHRADPTARRHRGRRGRARHRGAREDRLARRPRRCSRAHARVGRMADRARRHRRPRSHRGDGWLGRRDAHPFDHDRRGRYVCHRRAAARSPRGTGPACRARAAAGARHVADRARLRLPPPGRAPAGDRRTVRDRRHRRLRAPTAREAHGAGRAQRSAFDAGGRGIERGDTTPGAAYRAAPARCAVDPCRVEPDDQ